MSAMLFQSTMRKSIAAALLLSLSFPAFSENGVDSIFKAGMGLYKSVKKLVTQSVPYSYEMAPTSDFRFERVAIAVSHPDAGDLRTAYKLRLIKEGITVIEHQDVDNITLGGTVLDELAISDLRNLLGNTGVIALESRFLSSKTRQSTEEILGDTYYVASRTLKRSIVAKLLDLETGEITTLLIGKR